jgi:chromosome segregation protein
VTLDGAVVRPDGRIEGGQGDAVATAVLDSQLEMRELALQIETLQLEVSQHFEALLSARAQLARTSAGVDSARTLAHSSELSLLTAEKDRQKAIEKLDSLTRRLTNLSAEDAEMTLEYSASESEKDHAARNLAEAQVRAQGASAELGEVEAAFALAQGDVDLQRQSVTSSKVGIAGVREKLASLRGTVARLIISAKELEDRSSRLQAEMERNASALREAAAEHQAHLKALGEARDAALVAVDQLTQVRANFEALRAGLIQREGALKDAREFADSVREELREHELALRERELAVGHLVSGIAERFRGLSLPRVVGDYHMRPPPDDVLHARIDELARLIERMGPVNLDAVREHAEAQQRLDTHTIQRADLDKALSDLTRAIHQMNRESKRLFEETFQAVNARFQVVFPRMFAGGRAELRLTQPDDILETGIDIVAQPPGKKLSSIELMSGGEKALTAVSLVFAIFQIKPSPFCILDEVDAPLDEANVARYNDIVRSMTDRSQFIIITHIKRTMQAVDVLYGVTMPEPGVSKIVSVKINDAVAARTNEAQVA